MKGSNFAYFYLPSYEIFKLFYSCLKMTYKIVKKSPVDSYEKVIMFNDIGFMVLFIGVCFTHDSSS